MVEETRAQNIAQCSPSKVFNVFDLVLLDITDMHLNLLKKKCPEVSLRSLVFTPGLL